jgi:hypothetical protein
LSPPAFVARGGVVGGGGGGGVVLSPGGRARREHDPGAGRLHDGLARPVDVDLGPRGRGVVRLRHSRASSRVRSLALSCACVHARVLTLLSCERCDGDGTGQACQLDCQRAREGRRGRDNAQVRWGVMCTSGGAVADGFALSLLCRAQSASRDGWDMARPDGNGAGRCTGHLLALHKMTTHYMY